MWGFKMSFYFIFFLSLKKTKFNFIGIVTTFIRQWVKSTNKKYCFNGHDEC